MNPWIESVAALLVIAAGAGLGIAIGRRPAPWWFVGYLVPLATLLSIGATRRFERLYFTTPLSFWAEGRVQYLALAAAVQRHRQPVCSCRGRSPAA